MNTEIPLATECCLRSFREAFSIKRVMDSRSFSREETEGEKVRVVQICFFVATSGSFSTQGSPFSSRQVRCPTTFSSRSTAEGGVSAKSEACSIPTFFNLSTSRRPIPHIAPTGIAARVSRRRCSELMK